MANIKQQIKRIKTSEKARQANSSFKSALKTSIKNVKNAVLAKDVEAAKNALDVAYKMLDKALSKKIVHKNYVARNKSSLANLVNSIQ